jgi:hypothetical protein
LDALANANSSISKQILMGGANFPVIVRKFWISHPQYYILVVTWIKFFSLLCT